MQEAPQGAAPIKLTRLRLGVSLVALAWVLATGCSSIRVQRAGGPTVAGSWTASSVVGEEISPRTRQTIRRYDLESLYPDRLAELSGKLHGELMKEPQPGLLFALAEINYLRGVRAEHRQQPEACAYFYLAAGYAYHYLFDHGKKSDQDRPGDDQPERLRADVFDPRFRLACDLYNASLSHCLIAAQSVGQLDPRERLVLPGIDGRETITLQVTHTGFRYRPNEFGPVQVCSDFVVSGMSNHHRTYGLGVPLIGSRDPEAPLPDHSFYPSHVSFPITAFFRFEGSLADLHERRSGRLEFYNPRNVQTVKIGERAVPLETDLTTPLAYYLANARLESDGYIGFLRPDSMEEKAGIHALEPYEPGRIPVILVHGLLGSPMTWAPMFNDLQADPKLRSRYQFWVYFYPTGNPYLITAGEMRRELNRLRKTLDPQGKDPALNDMVLVGHSMGGLVSRLMTIDGGEDFWKVASGVPFDSLHLQPTTRAELRNTFYFERQPYVTRAIFLGTPHRGSKLSPSLVGRLGAYLAGVPSELLELQANILEDNPNLAESWKNRRVTSVDLLAPEAPALQLIAARPKPRGVQYHSIIGQTPKNVLLVERLFGGGYCQASDGVVPVASARLPEAESELIVSADHYHVHHHPLAILEVRRILLEHLREHDARNHPVQHAVGRAN
ncbi:MAG: hypothetical protein U0840_08505 [Gemmataceae bacterium]